MDIGCTQSFVIAQGFCQVGEAWGLLGHDASLRLFAQLSADPDHPAARPVEAYQALLSAMQPGWVVRWLQIFWPDSQPRSQFLDQVQTWPAAADADSGSALLHQGLRLYLQEAPLPFMRRTILEFQIAAGENTTALQQASTAWWQGLPGLCEPYGVVVQPLSRTEIQKLASLIFNPELG